ncbi:hypothetical protein K461DRAFT_225416 [Myriangium duriaei CBS 260.36]|uniref:RWD domain-containing protein n=1 Tax=Myriangium duriaei CBS 260.36 TaxID=1168546 RepID=A0A9P4MH99_9PEZI|nr:hypothetical protein K461DRAFT_225416 [Myriangium duriaei CBS 260.36]
MAVLDPHPPHEGDSIFDSPTFEKDLQIHVDEPIGSATISPGGRDVALASKHGLYIIDLDSPFSPPRHIRNETPWTPADVQWSPFASRYYWVVSTSNQRALVWNLELGASTTPIEFVLHAHSRAVTDINFSPFHPDVLATCAVDGFVHSWDLRVPTRPAISFSDWFAGATQVKWNRQDPHIVASSHDRFLRIWDDRKGAIPLTSIDAHATKIYGIDWSRSDASRVITCSLDRTIKVWDWSASDVHPDRIIRTPYPVWRARHTPFGEGILAMPQRGDHKLHLFDGKQDNNTPWDAHVDPVYSFKGHGDSVKEFLWRARGTIHDNTDDRDFQLVSWGSDHELILHKMRDKYFHQVGYEKGMHIERFSALTRRGSPYKSFRDSPPAKDNPAIEGHVAWQVQHELNGIDSSRSKEDQEGSAEKTIPVGSMARPSDRSHQYNKPSSDVINWMRGVRFGKGPRVNGRDAKKSLHLLSKIAGHHLARETLSDEIIHVSDRFAKITFEDVDVKTRSARLSLYGPWGAEGKPAFVALEVSFPRGYPRSACPSFTLGRSSALSVERIDQLEQDLERIAYAHMKHRIGCLDSILSFLTGELSLKQSIAWLATDDENAAAIDKDDSSSDEEDTLGDFATSQSQVLIPGEGAGPDILSSNANVGIPKACGAIWAPDGRLICFFPPKAQPPSLFEKIRLAPTTRNKSDVMHEGFGRMPQDDLGSRLAASPSPAETPEESDTDDESTSSSSSDSDEEHGFPAFSTGLYRRRAWAGSIPQKAKLRSTSVEGSQRTSAGVPKASTSVTPKTIVSIQIHDDVLPAKYELAEEYKVFGDSIAVCRHNSEVALDHGYENTADVWSLLALILSADVPLVSLMLDSQRSALVMAKRALLRLQRHDKGFDLTFDDPGAMAYPHLWGQLKWGNHPFASAWLIDQIFDHFERLADVQMLAMLACVLADANDQFAGDSLEAQRSLATISSLWPGHSVPYYPSREVADFSHKPLISISTSNQKSFDTSFGTYGSAPSSDGIRERDSQVADLSTPFSMGSTPPFPLSRNNTTRSSLVASLSVSPETKPPAPLSTNSSFAASMWSRPFQLSSSPPARYRTSGDENLAGSLASSGGVTWGPITIHGSNSFTRRGHNIPETDTFGDTESTEEDEPPTPDGGVKVVLRNQMQFEDEGAADVPLLSGVIRQRCIGYREAYSAILDTWGLCSQATEVRKFNAQSLEFDEPANDVVPSQVFDDSTSQITMVIGKDGMERGQVKGLMVNRCCIKCGHLQEGKRRNSACPRCGAGRRMLSCGVCMEPIRGLHKACLNCGHIAHMECLMVLEGFGQDGDGQARVGSCETGCGCQCAAFGALNLE